MSYSFPCASVSGLTTAQKREAIAALREAIKADTIAKREAKALQREARAAAKADKIATAIAKAEARLQKLLSKAVGPVGAKAKKASKRAGKVKSFSPAEIAEANAIAAKLQSK